MEENNHLVVERSRDTDKKRGQISSPKIIFRYEVGPSCGFMHEMRIKTIIIFSNNTRKDVIKDGREQVISEETTSVDSSFVEDLSTTIRKRWSQIKQIPKNLYNDTCDGTTYVFQFKNKKIGALNIKKINIDEIKVTNFPYYEEFKENIYYENLVLEIYDEIKLVFQKYNVTTDDLCQPR